VFREIEGGEGEYREIIRPRLHAVALWSE